MKRNKPETHFRLKPYLKNWIDEIAKFTGATMTSVVEDALEKGLSYRIKMIRKELDPNFLKKEEQAQEQKNNNTKYCKELTDNFTEEEIEKNIRISKIRWIPKE